MGSGIKIRCEKCGYEFSAMLGIGMLFPCVYEETVQEIKAGEYGEEYKKFFEEHPNAAVNCEAVTVVCEKCGKFDSVKDLSLYIPKDDSTKNPGYVVEEDLESDYKKCKEYDHKCSCGGSMKRIDLLEKLSDKDVKCPECKGDMILLTDGILWD